MKANAKNRVRYAHSASAMELNWLEDILALAQHRNFSRAAEARNITQPAFSRRIRALEDWVGTQLVMRSPQGVVLNAAGEVICQGAVELVRDLHQLRGTALKAAGRESAALTIAATHALSFTFFPGWLRSLALLESLGTLSLVSDTMAACERILVAGDAHFLLCHTHSDLADGLARNSFTSVVVGADVLVPVSAPDAMGQPRWPVTGRTKMPVRVLTYTSASGLARILQAKLTRSGQAPSFETIFTSPLAATLQTMARQGEGAAWLPLTMAAEDIAAGQLVDAGEGAFSIKLDIRLFRPLKRQSEIAELFWSCVLASAKP